mmetsp:Transcript_24376/g.70131  ORF Transcript_24376/g.70131 Transcript_24376/m.70131 type:complete len:214 (-) Transcript_24376:60-701(-)
MASQSTRARVLSPLFSYMALRLLMRVMSCRVRPADKSPAPPLSPASIRSIASVKASAASEYFFPLKRALPRRSISSILVWRDLVSADLALDVSGVFSSASPPFLPEGVDRFLEGTESEASADVVLPLAFFFFRSSPSLSAARLLLPPPPPPPPLLPTTRHNSNAARDAAATPSAMVWDRVSLFAICYNIQCVYINLPGNILATYLQPYSLLRS